MTADYELQLRSRGVLMLRRALLGTVLALGFSACAVAPVGREQTVAFGSK